MKEKILELSSTSDSLAIARGLNIALDDAEDVLIDAYWTKNMILDKANLKLAAKDVYNNPIERVAYRYNVSPPTLRKYLEKCHLHFMNMIVNQKKDANWEELIEKYNSGMSLSQLEQLYDINRKIITAEFKVRNISTSKITFDDTYFDKIDSEEKAYWLGFLYADGAISSAKNDMELSLNLFDFEHLLKLKNCVKAKRDIRYQYKGIQRCRLNLASKHFKERLIALGCPPQKSLILKFPTEEQVPPEHQIAFIRGYFDGDGCLSYRKQSELHQDIVTPELSLLGTEDFIKGCFKYLPTVSIRLANNDGNELCKCVSWSKNDSIQILNLLYSNANIYLSRKYARYQIFKDNNFAVSISDFRDNDQAISVESKQKLNQYYNIDIDKLMQDNTEISN